MKHFSKQLSDRNSDPGGRRWLYVPYDQLSDRVGPLRREDPRDLGVVLVDTSWKAGRRPYHKMKLAYVMANQRHFALEQAERGVAVAFLSGSGSYGAMLREFVEEQGLDEPVRVMEPAERELRVELASLVDDGLLEEIEHEGWLTTAEDFEDSVGEAPWRMDTFYRHMRKKSGILMTDDGKYEGGKLSHDHDNREFWPGPPEAPAAPAWPTWGVDEIKQEVGEFIEERYAHHPGPLDLSDVVATVGEAKVFWAFGKKHCMEHFGPYEDAMSSKSRTLFHTRLSTLMNMHRITPRQAVEDVRRMKIPINSKEGFIRQVFGWREFMYHVHRATDGFREMPGDDVVKLTIKRKPGTGGYEKWAEGAGEFASTHGKGDPDGGAAPTALDATEPVPAAYWGKKSGLNCLDTVVEDVWAEGWSHHIPRLMVLGNFATLLDISPRDLTDWFWVAYTDAYDWVVESNVLGMGTYGLGDLFVTKPYVSGSNYINKMSDYCGQCAFDPKKDCPIGRLYWAFLARHEKALRDNPRLARIYSTLDRRSAEHKAKDTKTFKLVRDTLRNGGELEPEISGLFAR